jgi:hypothetical protein
VLGKATSERLLKRFRDAATELRDTWLEYAALHNHFNTKWNSAAWKFTYSKFCYRRSLERRVAFESNGRSDRDPVAGKRTVYLDGR